MAASRGVTGRVVADGAVAQLDAVGHVVGDRAAGPVENQPRALGDDHPGAVASGVAVDVDAALGRSRRRRPVSATAVSAGAPGAVRSTVTCVVTGVASRLPAASVAAIATLVVAAREAGQGPRAACTARRVASSSAQAKVMSSCPDPART